MDEGSLRDAQRCLHYNYEFNLLLDYHNVRTEDLFEMLNALYTIIKITQILL